MAEFLLMYQGGDPNWRDRPAAEIEAAMQRWRQWFQQLEATGNLRSPGAPLGPETAVLRNRNGGVQTDSAMAEVKELVGGYSIITADSFEKAVEIAKGCPFLRNQPAGAVVVRPVLQID